MGLDDKIRNQAEEVKGKAKEGAGKVTDNERLEAEGHVDQTKANLKQAGAWRQSLLYSIAAAILILLLLQAAFGSWRLAALLFAALPVALVGGVVAISLTGLGISLASLVGLLAVYGIAARNGVLLIKHFQRLEYEENETFGEELVLRGARERAVPVMTMALTLGLALVPVLFRGSIPGGEMLYPMAVVVIGGLITSTLVTLFVVPALYLRFGSRREDRQPAIDEPAVNEPAISQPAS